jgi:phosphatidylserine decarboxylase
VAVSGADARTMLFDSIDESRLLWIKGHQFTLKNLFGDWDTDGSKAREYEGASLVISRLAPQDYVRYFIPLLCACVVLHCRDMSMLYLVNQMIAMV